MTGVVAGAGGDGGGDAKMMTRVTQMTLTMWGRMTRGAGEAGAGAGATQHSVLQRNHTTHEQ